MTFLLLALSSNYYALPASQVLEVIPNLIEHENQQNEMPDYFAGSVNFRGKQIPIIDLCLVHKNRPAHRLLSSRIILINHQISDSKYEIIGLLAEKVTETIQLKDVKEDDPDYLDHTFKIEHFVNSSSNAIKPFVIEKMLPDNFSEIFSQV